MEFDNISIAASVLRESRNSMEGMNSIFDFNDSIVFPLLVIDPISPNGIRFPPIVEQGMNSCFYCSPALRRPWTVRSCRKDTYRGVPRKRLHGEPAFTCEFPSSPRRHRNRYHRHGDFLPVSFCPTGSIIRKPAHQHLPIHVPRDREHVRPGTHRT